MQSDLARNGSTPNNNAVRQNERNVNRNRIYYRETV